MKTIAFLGTGNMGSAIISAACRSIDPGEVVIADRDFEKAVDLAQRLGCTAVRDNDEAVRSAKYVMLCVKPQVLPGVLSSISPLLVSSLDEDTPKVLVSIAAGVSIASLRDIVKSPLLPIIRIMPNIPALVGQGLMLLAHDETVSREDIQAVEGIIKACGEVRLIPENLMDQATVLSSCAPAYAYMFIEALSDAGISMGLSAEQSRLYAAKALMGAAAMVLDTGSHPAALREMVCSPGGSTIAGVLSLEADGFRGSVIKAAAASYKRTAELG